MEYIKKYWMILLIGILIRLIIAGATYHPDVRILNFTSAVILREGILDPYQYAYSGQSKIISDEKPDDLPLQYWIHLPVDLIFRPLIDIKTEDAFLANAPSLFGNVSLNWHLLVIKIPLIISDVLLGVFLSFLVSLNLRKKALALWLFNPMTLWATIAVGQVDIWPVFFVILSVFFLQKNNKNLAALSLGTGAALKSFPFLIAPFLIFMEKSWLKRLKLGILLIIPWFLTTIPYINSPEFRRNALFAPQMDKIFYSKIMLSGGEGVYLSILVLFYLYFMYLKSEKILKNFMSFSASALLLVLSVTHFHIQWFLWVTPFLIINIIEDKKEYMILTIAALFAAVLGMLLLFEKSLSVGIFSPVWPILDRTLGLTEILSKDQADLLRNIFASIFAAASLFYSVNILRKNE